MSAAHVSPLPRRPRIEQVDVTPELARVWLDRNDSNRPIRRPIWKSYARDMQAGAWRLTAEPIKVSPAGKLLDGQHRLHAVIDAGVTVPMFVAYDVPEDAQTAMDTGAKRTAADALNLRGEAHASLVAAAARLALGVAYAPESIGRYTATHAEVLGWVDEHPDIFDCAGYVSTIRGRIKGCPPSVIAYTLHALAQIDRAEAFAFWAAVADQVGEYPGDPIVALARKFSETYREREDVPKSAYLSMIYRAWNSRRGNKPLRAMRVNSPGANGGLIPVPVPR
jgi:hypothetical protein